MRDYKADALQRLGRDNQVTRQAPTLPPQRAEEIMAQIRRHNIAILYLVAELRTGRKPEKITVEGDIEP